VAAILITASVGQNGRNVRSDVTTVQGLLLARGHSPGTIDGLSGTRTINAIRSFQGQYMTQPDGLVEPGMGTWKRLIGFIAITPPTKAAAAASTGAAKPVEAKWSGDSAQWSQEKKLESMKPDMAAKVRAVITDLTLQKFQPYIFYGWRSVAVQQELFKKGASRVKFSFHNAQLPDGTPYSYAADIVDRRWMWRPDAEKNGFWSALGAAARKQGLVWGGDWVSFKDVAHIQLVSNDQLKRIKKESGL